ncbi:hypothetical protein [Rubripirellula tenax]|nr:hypothetical protein [Rubripirellula tenax]
MKKLIMAVVTCALFSSTADVENAQAQGQNAVLADYYGQGVHAYYAGRSSEAYELLSTAINNGIKDPRAYYFRGIVATQTGRGYEADSDWQQGAELEAAGKGSGSVGQALHRFQGPERLKLEDIRRKAKLDYLANAEAQSRQRYGELGVQGSPSAPRVAPAPAPSAIQPPPPAPVAAEQNPFGERNEEPKVESDDALADAMNDPFGGDAATPADAGAADAPADPFSTGGDAADPFGGGGDAMADPFGTDASKPAADPFGDDPFGN